MAMLFTDGFEAGDAALKWSAVVGGSSSTDTRFSVGRSWSLSTTGDAVTFTFGQKSQIFIGFAFKCSAAGTGRFIDIKGDSGATTHLSLAFPTTTTIDLVRGTSTVIASATLSQPLTWGTYLEVSASIADAGGTCVVRANGTTLINFTGDTKNAGTGSWVDTVTIIKATGFTPGLWIDDLYFCDSIGSAPNNTFLGDIRIYTLTPDGAGTTTQMTPSSGANYTTVDELPYSATDYVRGSSGQSDLYTTSNLPAGVGTIFGVQANAIVKKTDAGALSGRTVIKSGSTTTNGTSINLGTSDVTITNVQGLNPDTSMAWTAGDVNSLEIGSGVV